MQGEGKELVPILLAVHSCSKWCVADVATRGLAGHLAIENMSADFYCYIESALQAVAEDPETSVGFRWACQ